MKEYTLRDLIVDISDNIVKDCEEDCLTVESIRERLVNLVSATNADLTDTI